MATAVYNIEGSIYWGTITNLSGDSGRGTLLSAVQDKLISFSPSNPAVASFTLRDLDVTSLRLLLSDLMAVSDTGVSGSSSSVKKPGQAARTFQFAVVPITTTLPMLYFPCAAVTTGNQFRRWGLEPWEVRAVRAALDAPGEMFWGRAIEALDGRLTIAATCPPGQSTAPWMRDTAANVATAYSLTA